MLTGAAGFIGAGFIRRLLSGGGSLRIVGLDDMNGYYDPALKEERIEAIRKADTTGQFTFIRGDVRDRAFLHRTAERFRPETIVHLAAQAGVRHSLECPEEYMSRNVDGFFEILELCRAYPDMIGHLVFASSSSVYGARNEVPFSVEDRTGRPESFYAATKMTNEIMAYAYSAAYGVRATACRFFTVYGPAGRPDMAYYRFAETLAGGGRIQLYNFGKCLRDFTYIDDVAEALVRIIDAPPGEEEQDASGNAASARGKAPYAVYNVGGERPVELERFVRILADELVRAGVLPEDFDLEEHIERVPMPKGDVEITCADPVPLEVRFGFRPGVPLEQGLRAFVEWFASRRQGGRA